jgi:NAD(P)H-dependent flavin oxidoreductase YrpB (nitropropane dioxygenase family)
MASLPLLPMMVNAVAPLPVLCAGGIADGRGLAAALALGAEGALLGTRFMATPEAPIHANFKQAIVDSNGHDTVLTEIPDLVSQRVWPGAMSRAKRNRFIERWAGREWVIRQDAAEIAKQVAAARVAGDVDNASLFFGQDAGLIDSSKAPRKSCVISSRSKKSFEGGYRSCCDTLRIPAGRRKPTLSTDSRRGQLL